MRKSVHCFALQSMLLFFTLMLQILRNLLKVHTFARKLPGKRAAKMAWIHQNYNKMAAPQEMVTEFLYT